MSKEYEWLRWFVSLEGMHSFDSSNFLNTDSYLVCEWCGERWVNWKYGGVPTFCNCGENDLPKPEREVLL